jgi:ABC-type bacteriocin/lantibiotic exporter with double-glycine peptidase domain
MKQEISIKTVIFQKGIENNTKQITSLFMDHYWNRTSWNFFSSDVLGYQPVDNDVDRLNAITILSPNLMAEIHKSDAFLRLEADVQNEQLNRVGYSFGFVLCFLIAFFLKSVTNWLNLRTAARLRSAVLTSVYLKSVESRVDYGISAHQIMALANEESVHLFGFVENGALIIGNLFGVMLVLLAALTLLSWPGIWPIFGIFLIFPLIAVLAKYSSFHYRRGMFHSSVKSTVVEEVCLNFKRILVLGFEQVFSERFRSEYLNFLIAQILTSIFSKMP